MLQISYTHSCLLCMFVVLFLFFCYRHEWNTYKNKMRESSAVREGEGRATKMMHTNRWLCDAVFTLCTVILGNVFIFIFISTFISIIVVVIVAAVAVVVWGCSPTCIKVDCCEIYCILFGVFACTFITLVALSRTQSAGNNCCYCHCCCCLETVEPFKQPLNATAF